MMLRLVAATTSVFAASCTGLTSHEMNTYMELQYSQYDHGTLKGQAQCRFHHVSTVPWEVPERPGMCVVPSGEYLEYVRSRLRYFPNSYWDVNSCFCTGGQLSVPRRVCPTCRQLELEWRRRHGWPTDTTFALPPPDELNDDDNAGGA